MNKERGQTTIIRSYVGGSVHGNVLVGENQVLTIMNAPDSDSPEKLREAIEAFKKQVAEVAPADVKDDAIRRAGMLEGEATAKTPDASILTSVKTWFLEHVPAVAESVGAILGHPILGRVLGAAGRALGT